LPEWITFHRLQGVGHFYLYDHLSTDDWSTALEPEIASGLVDVTNWPVEPGQASAYVDCLLRHRGDARWIAFVDVDEFLFSPTGSRLPVVLRRFETYPGVTANWRCYGPNDWEQAPHGLVIENFPRRAADDHPMNRFVKSIVYPRKAIEPKSPHHFRYRGGPSVGEDGGPVEWTRRESTTADLLRINHYFAKSRGELQQKIVRPTAWDGKVGVAGTGSWSDIPLDEVRDDVILQFAPAVLAALEARKT
jgi:hypothetical protein